MKIDINLGNLGAYSTLHTILIKVYGKKKLILQSKLNKNINISNLKKPNKFVVLYPFSI